MNNQYRHTAYANTRASRIVIGIFSVSVLVLAYIYMYATAFAAFNPEVNYQGKLTNSANVAVADGAYHMRFKLYTAETGGTSVHTEDRSNVAGNRIAVSNGLFSAMIGSSSPITAIDWNQPLWLEVEVGGTASSSWETLTPRKRLGAVPAAFVADTLDGINSTQFVRADAPTSIASTSASTLLTITQSGTGDILNLFDGASEVFTVLDGGNVGIGSSSPSAKLTVEGGLAVSGTVTATNLVATGTLTVSGLSSLQNASTTNLTIANRLYDGSNSAGQSGYVLQSTGTGVVWVATTTLGFGGGGASTFLALTDTPSSFTSNRIPFTNAGATALTDSANFVFTGTNLGIGSTSPIAELVVASANPSFIVDDNDAASTQLEFVASGATAYIRSGVDSLDTAARFRVVRSGTTATNIANFDIYASTTFLNGALGIGTTTPQSEIVVHDASGDSIIAISGSNSSNRGIQFNLLDGSPSWSFLMDTNEDLVLREFRSGNDDFRIQNTAGTDLIFLDTSAGTFGIGTSTPASTLTVSGSGLFTGNLQAANITATGTLGVSGLATFGNATFTNATTSMLGLTGVSVNGVLYTNANGTVLSTTSLSDALVADNITVSNGTITGGNISGTLITTGTLTIGDGGDRIDINSSGWDVTNSVITGATWNGATIGTLYGGTGVTATPQDGELLIGDGLGYTLSTLTAGAGISITNGAGAITITNASTTQWGTNGSSIYYNGGNVGIGTSSPFASLQIASATTPYLALTNMSGAADAKHWLLSNSGDNIFRIGQATDALSATSTKLLIDSSRENFYVGSQVGTSTGIGNIAIGAYTLFSNTTGSSNNGLGDSTLYGNTTGSNNNAFGPSALLNNTTGSYNNALGISALQQNTTGSNNNALGNQSLSNNTTGSNNIGIGQLAGYTLTTGTSTTFLGAFADASSATLSTSTALGAGSIVGCSNCLTLGGTGQNYTRVGIGTSTPAWSLQIASATTPYLALTNMSGDVDAKHWILSNSGDNIFRIGQATDAFTGTTTSLKLDTGNSNYAVGYYALANNTDGGGNIAFGDNSLVNNISGSYSTAIGHNALPNNYSSYNTALGYRSLFSNSYGENNIGIGQEAGSNITTGTSTTFLGAFANASSATLSTSTALGAGSVVGCSNCLTLGGTGQNYTRVGIGTSTPAWSLQIASATTPYLALTNMSGAADAKHWLLSNSGDGIFRIGQATDALSATSTKLLIDSANNNFYVGTQVGTSTGYGNNALGENALFSNTTGSGNNAFGYRALFNNTSGTYNNALGENVLLANTTGSNNNALGNQTLRQNTSGEYNNAIGYNALRTNTTGRNNNAIGQYALYENTTGASNNALGFQALYQGTTGSNNIGIGESAGVNNTTGWGNIALGTRTYFPTAAGNQQLNIGNILYGSLPATSTSFQLPTSGGIGIGSTSPMALLTIHGNQGDTRTNLFVIGSTSGSGATTTLFSVANTGALTVSNSATSSFSGGLSTGALQASSLRVTGGVYDSLNSSGTNGMVLQTTGAGAVWVATSTLGLGAGGSNFFTNSGDNTYLSTGSRLGIGTSTPAWSLQIASATTPYLALTNMSGDVDAKHWLLSNSGDNIFRIGQATDAMTSTSTQLLIDSYNGNFRVGQGNLGTSTGSNNNALGFGTLNGNTTGYSNNAFGVGALTFNTTGNNNNAVGEAALAYNTTGDSNNAYGLEALRFNTTGSDNNALGEIALYSNTTGSNNIGLGRRAGYTITTGTSTTFLGAFADASSATLSTSTALGAGSIVGCSNCLTLGGTGQNYTRVGIGTSTPAWSLQIASATTPYLALTNMSGASGAKHWLLSNTGDNIFRIGQASDDLTSTTSEFFIDSAKDNFSVGENSLAANTSGDGNIALGWNSLSNNTSGWSNVAIGPSALSANISGVGNLSIGQETLNNNGTGSYNTAFGHQALSNNNSGSNNIGIGQSAGSIIVSGTSTTFLGAFADASSATLSTSTALGAGSIVGCSNCLTLGGTGQNYTRVGIGTSTPAWSLQIASATPYIALTDTDADDYARHWLVGNTNGVFTVVGAGGDMATTNTQVFGLDANNSNIYAGYTRLHLENTTGGQNIAFGDAALNFNADGTYNIALGSEALRNNTTGWTNIGLGRGALYNTESGSNNIGIGERAAYNNTTGWGNIAIGERTYFPTATGNRQLNIGNILYGSLPATSTSFQLPTSGGIGIGSTSPMALFTIHGNQGDTRSNLFVIGSTSGSGATTTLFAVANTGALIVNNSATSTFAAGASTTGLTTSFFRNTGAFYDANNSAGASSSVLLSTGSGARWFATSSLGFIGTSAIDTCAEFAAIITGETGTCGSLVLSASPTFTGTANFANASSTNLSSGYLAVGQTGTTTLTTNGYVLTNRLGIGTTTPYWTAQIASATTPYLALTNLAGTGNNKHYLLSNTGDGIFRIGKANDSLTTFSSSTKLLIDATNNNFIVGLQGGTSAGSSNNAFGNFAMGNNISGINNNALGQSALVGTTTGSVSGSDNNAFGSSALSYNASGSHNNALGYQALLRNESGSSNNALGYFSNYSNTTGSNNNAIGNSALFNNTTGQSNNALGYQTLFLNTTGSFNNAFGQEALTGNTEGFSNNAIGNSALYSNTTGSFNNALGESAGVNNTTGWGNIALGTRTYFPTAAGNQQLNIGNILYGSLPATSTQFQLPTTGGIGIGSSSPMALLTIHGNQGDTRSNLFVIGSTSGSGATTTLFSVANTGALTVSNSATSSFSGGLSTGALQSSSLRVTGGVYDTNNTRGTSGMVLQTTGTGVQWVATSTLGLGAGGSNFFTNSGDNTYLSTGSNLGVGTTTPWGQLSVNPNGISGPSFVIGSSTKTDFVVTNTGNVGIGSTNPLALLSVGTGGILDANVPVQIGAESGALTYFGANKGSTYGALFGYRNNSGGYTGGEIRIVGNEPLRMLTNDTERLRIDNSGNVGIGTTSPTTKLSILQSSGSVREIADFMNSSRDRRLEVVTDIAGDSISYTGINSREWLSSNPMALALQTGGVNRLYITSGGNVGIGTSSPTQKLEIYQSDIQLDNGQGIMSRLLGTNTSVTLIRYSGTNSTLIGANSEIALGGSVFLQPASTGDVFATLDADTDLDVGSGKLYVRGDNGNIGAGSSTPNWQLTLASSTPYLALSDTNAGTNAKNWLVGNHDGIFTIGTSTDNYSATTSLLTITNASTTFARALAVSSTGTSTFQNGINIAAGCFSVNGVCVTSGSGTNFFTNSGNDTYLSTGSKLGIGTSTPYWTTQIASATTPYLALTNMSGTSGAKHWLLSNSGDNIFRIGQASDGLSATSTKLLIDSANNNFYVGTQVGTSTGLYNTAIGYQALFRNTTGASNNALGFSALGFNTTGTYNNAIGDTALLGSTTAGQSGTHNNAFGYQSLYRNATGNYNNAFGNNALYYNTSGSDNNALGRQALQGSTTAGNSGSNNNAFGSNALTSNFSGTGNNAIGVETLNTNGTGNYNNAIGYQALYGNTSGEYNNALGYRAGSDITSGSANIVIGYWTIGGTSITTGSNNILLGQGVRAGLSQTGSNQLNIGNLIFGTTLGTDATFATGNLGVGTSSPFAKFTVVSSSTANETNPLFWFATTSSMTGSGHRPILWGFATTTGDLNRERVAIGTTSVWGTGGIRDSLTVDGRIYSTWRTLTCDFMGVDITTAITGDTTNTATLGTGGACGIFRVDEDTDGNVPVATANVPPYMRLEAGVTTDPGVGESSSLRTSIHVAAAAYNPVVEILARTPGTIGAGSYFRLAGFSDTAFGSDMAAEPSNGYYFAATSSNTWKAVTRSGSVSTVTDTGIATSSVNFQRLRIEASTNRVEFLINGTVVANHTTNISAGNVSVVMTTGITTGGVAGTAAQQRQMDIASVRLWVDDPPGEVPAALASTPEVIYDDVQAADLALSYLVGTTTKLISGMMVSNKDVEKRVTHTTAPYDSSVIGVVSTDPFASIGQSTASTTRVSLLGRAPVIVSLENGPIAQGDAIVASAIPGVGMKATMPGQIVGRALEAVGYSSCDEALGEELEAAGIELPENACVVRILSTIEPGFSLNVSSMFAEAATSTPSFATLAVELASSAYAQGASFTKFVIGQVNAQIAYIGSLFAEEVHTKKLCVADAAGNETCITKDQLDALLISSAGVPVPPDNGGDTGSGNGGSGNGGGTGGGGNADTEAPMIAVVGGTTVNITVGDTYADQGAVVTDNIDTSSAYTVSLDGGAHQDPSALSLDTSAPGTHWIEYRAVDAAGNVGTATRNIVVEAAPAPEPPPEPPPQDPPPEPPPSDTGSGTQSI